MGAGCREGATVPSGAEPSRHVRAKGWLRPERGAAWWAPRSWGWGNRLFDETSLSRVWGGRPVGYREGPAALCLPEASERASEACRLAGHRPSTQPTSMTRLEASGRDVERCWGTTEHMALGAMGRKPGRVGRQRDTRTGGATAITLMWRRVKLNLGWPACRGVVWTSQPPRGQAYAVGPMGPSPWAWPPRHGEGADEGWSVQAGGIFKIAVVIRLVSRSRGRGKERERDREYARFMRVCVRGREREKERPATKGRKERSRREGQSRADRAPSRPRPESSRGASQAVGSQAWRGKWGEGGGVLRPRGEARRGAERGSRQSLGLGRRWAAR